MVTWPLAAQDVEDDMPPEVEGGAFFFEVTTQSLSFGQRDLNGSMVLGNEAQVFFIPSVKPGIGFGAGFGRRFRSGLWSVSYLVSGHDVAFQGRNGTAVSRLLQINSRTYFLKTPGLKAFAQFGLNFPWMKVDDNSMDTGGNVFDATYMGVGANVGAGLQVPVSSRMFFSASLVYRLIAYLYAQGPGRGIDVTDMFDDVSGPRHRLYLRAPVVALEISLAYAI